MGQYVLEIVEGPDAGRQVPVDGPLEIGRDPGAGVALAGDELVSRRHVRLEPVADGLRVEDLESRNGTFVNGDEIQSPAHLSPGGQLLVGVTVFELRGAQTPAGVTAVKAVPEALTTLRPIATASPDATAVRQIPSPLATSPAVPDYVPQGVLPEDRARDALLTPLLDVHTKSKARTAPLAVFVLVALLVFVYFVYR
jgi:hypothetical protein